MLSKQIHFNFTKNRQFFRFYFFFFFVFYNLNFKCPQMMANVKYHFGVMRNGRGDHQRRAECSALERDVDSTHFSLDDDEDGYSTILGHNTLASNGGASSRLLRTFPGGQQKESEMEEEKRNCGEQIKGGEMKNGGGGVRLERSRGPSRIRNSASKCSSLFTDEVELDDVEEENELASHSGSDDEDDLLPAFSHLGNGTANGCSGTIHLDSIGIGNNGGGDDGLAHGNWRHQLKQKLSLLCCFPFRGANGGGGFGFTQFK